MNFFEIFNETLEQNIRKSQEICFFFLDGKEDKNKAKLEIFKFFRKSALSPGFKIGGNYALSANSTKICLLGYFCMQNSYLR